MVARRCPRQLLALALALLASAHRAVLATLPADNGGVSSTAAGDLAPDFKVVCSLTNGSNYTLTTNNGAVASPVDAPSPGAALVVLAVTPPLAQRSAGGHSAELLPDLFVQNMVESDASLGAFLGSDAVGSDAVGNTSYLFLAHASTDADAQAVTAALRARLSAKAVKMFGSSAPDALARMHFAAEPVSATGALSVWLGEWTTPVTAITFPAASNIPNISRLDGSKSLPLPSAAPPPTKHTHI